VRAVCGPAQQGADFSVNQRLPSTPGATPNGPLPRVGIGNSLIEPLTASAAETPPLSRKAMQAPQTR